MRPTKQSKIVRAVPQADPKFLNQNSHMRPTQQSMMPCRAVPRAVLAQNPTQDTTVAYYFEI